MSANTGIGLALANSLTPSLQGPPTPFLGRDGEQHFKRHISPVFAAAADRPPGRLATSPTE